MGNLLPSHAISPRECSFGIDDVCNTVRSGDILLFTGDTGEGRLITSLCASRYSHIGIVYRDLDGIDTRPYMLESLKFEDQVPDVKTGLPAKGVRLVDLRVHLETMKQKCVAVRFLLSKQSLDIEYVLGIHMKKVLDKVIEAERGKPYEEKWSEFIMARFPFIEVNCETPNAFFCSELVAWCYMRAGLLDSKTIPACQFLPDDFSETKLLSLQYPRGLQFPGFNPASEGATHHVASRIFLSEEYYVDLAWRPPKDPLIEMV
jgi:hypothetical protein